jgi:3-hydroxy acid dehydrogenase/malonic semialdehyde reductase
VIAEDPVSVSTYARRVTLLRSVSWPSWPSWRRSAGHGWCGKGFVHQFSLNLRSDLHGTGVRVTCIEPGMSGGTEFSTVRFQGDDIKARAVYADMQPLTADDIAESVHWATMLPAHDNINTIELKPVAQSFAAFQVDRTPS